LTEENKSKIFLGWEKITSKLFFHDPKDLATHTLILGGSGSGKTVLIRRIIEEAALLKIPSIVVDIGNDLVRLGLKSESIDPEYQEKADRYFADTDVRVYTPGLSRGRPILLTAIPDFTSSSADDNPAASIDAVVEFLANSLGLSDRAHIEKAYLKTGVTYLANNNTHDLKDLIAFLESPPDEIAQSLQYLNKAHALASNLMALRINNPLFSDGPTATIDDILARDSSKTPISVFNLFGLGSLNSQQIFVSQLTQTYFNWAKKNPKGPLQGLLIIDEAKEFAPALKSSPAKGAIIRFASQARKYGLGLILATQEPKSVDSQIVNNCSTQFFGRFSSPTNIQTAEGLLQMSGVLNGLGAGHFFIRSSDSKAIELKIALGLSKHLSSAASGSDIISLSKNANYS
jgi:DNA helicase HerA-like ATPase